MNQNRATQEWTLNFRECHPRYTIIILCVISLFNSRHIVYVLWAFYHFKTSWIWRCRRSRRHHGLQIPYYDSTQWNIADNSFKWRGQFQWKRNASNASNEIRNSEAKKKVVLIEWHTLLPANAFIKITIGKLTQCDTSNAIYKVLHLFTKQQVNAIEPPVECVTK